MKNPQNMLAILNKISLFTLKSLVAADCLQTKTQIF